ncbi:RINT1-like protein [Agrilus planipennis]|uniref:RINT1-like protein n=1 Tax=Agrilus planipennis TaxID=224129 RepID=A0A7F5RKD5_AGRPL|nr:RINT1-like protein [Agrilus planipennis]
MAHIHKDVLKNFYKGFSDDLRDPETCRQLQKKYQKKVACLREEIDLNNDSSSIAQSVRNIESNAEKIKTVLEEAETVTNVLDQYLEKFREPVAYFESNLDKLNRLECTLQYYKVLERIEQLNVALQKEMAKKDDEQCATIYANLCEINRHLYNSTARNLREHLKEVILHWHNLLKEKFTKDLEEVLKTVKWPFVNVNLSLQEPSQNNINKLQIVVEYLLQIQPPEEIKIGEEKSGILSDFMPLCLPLELMISPLRKRFLYHFYGPRKTNRVDKPEWYFTQILAWIRDHSEFVEKWIQPVADRMGMHYIDTKIELMRGLIQLAVEKLNSDLPTLQYDDFTFSHSVDEALGFDKELRESYGYPPIQPGILCVLTQPQIFVKWLSMEKKYATEKMDLMLSPNSPEAFEPILTDIDDFKVTTCADMFITLLQTMTDRYELLPQPGHRLQFLELQLELLDDFRVRLLQLVHAEEGNIVESRVPMIVNTLFYIENVLIDWGSMLHFLNLFYYKNQLKDAECMNNSVDFCDANEENVLTEVDTDSVFADTLSLYRHMRIDLICNISESVFMECRARSRDYRHEAWGSITKYKDIRSFSLTPSACPIFEILAIRLHQLQKKLTSKLFAATWKNLAKKLDEFFFDELVMENRFNEGGALQLKYDITRNLFPLFSQYTNSPEIYFWRMEETCSLLNLSKGSALLLRETLIALEGATGVEDQRPQALKEVGVINFPPRKVIEILNRRTDITINRLNTID